MADTLESVEEQIAALQAALTQRLTTGIRTKVGYSSGSVEKTVGSVEDMRMEIARLEVVRKRLGGGATNGGPIRVGFGDRV